MDKRIANNALNYFLSKKFTFDGTDLMPLVEIVRDLQAIVKDGNPPDTQSGDHQAPAS